MLQSIFIVSLNRTGKTICESLRTKGSMLLRPRNILSEHTVFPADECNRYSGQSQQIYIRVDRRASSANMCICSNNIKQQA